MLYRDIKEEVKKALKARDEPRLTVLRGLIASATNELIAQRRKSDEDLKDEEVLLVIKQAVKQRKDSIEQFAKGGREDLVKKETEELKILEAYLPAAMSKEEIEKVASAKKEELGIKDRAKIGMLMGAVMKELAGKADGADVKEVVESLF